METAAAERMALNPAEVDHTFLVPLEHIVHNPPLEYSYALEPRPPADFPYQLIGIPRGYRWQQGRGDGARLSVAGPRHLGADRADHTASGGPAGRRDGMSGAEHLAPTFWR